MDNDVIVIGAGASVPYGFPTGFDIFQKIKSRWIIKHFSVMEHLYSYLEGRPISFKLNRNDLKDFIRVLDRKVFDPLRGSCVISIDQYLKNHLDDPEKQTIIKTLMAYLILECEAKAYSSRFDNSPECSFHLGNIDWIQSLLTKIDLEFKDNTSLADYLHLTTFITFNYDRVLEYFLLNYLTCDRNFPEETAHEMLNDMNIFHINGYIGSLRDVPIGNTQVDYTAVIQSMRTVWEDANIESTRLEKAKELLEESDRIFVLGTSYIPDNNQSIGLTAANLKGKQFFGTGYKLSKAKTDRVLHSLGRTANTEPVLILDVTALDLIEDEYVL